MKFNLDLSTANSQQIITALGEQIGQVRLTKNITQAQLAAMAGVSLKTISRLENGENSSLDSFVRVLMALDLQDNLTLLFPDVNIRPVERLSASGGERKRARHKRAKTKKSDWQWGE